MFWGFVILLYVSYLEIPLFFTLGGCCGQASTLASLRAFVAGCMRTIVVVNHHSNWPSHGSWTWTRCLFAQERCYVCLKWLVALKSEGWLFMDHLLLKFLLLKNMTDFVNCVHIQHEKKEKVSFFSWTELFDAGTWFKGVKALHCRNTRITSRPSA